MRVKAFGAMLGWLVLFGCDDPPEQKQFNVGGVNYTLTKEDSGCDDGKASVEREDGKKGTITINWDYAPAGAATVMVAILCLMAHRRVS